MLEGVVLQRNRGIATLLRAVVNQPVLADVEIAGSGSASPIVGFAFGDVVLERVHASEAALFEALHLVVDPALLIGERLQLAATVVNDADGGTEPEFDGTFSDH